MPTLNILDITFEKPSLSSGGGIGIYQSLRTALNCGSVDYIGPEFDKELKLDSINVLFNLKYDNSFLSRFKSMLDGIINGYYQSWKRNANTIVWNKYDVIIIEFTRYDFLVRECLRHNNSVFCRVHNIEKDYFHNLFLKDRCFKAFLREKYYSKSENYSVKHSKILIVLTDNDKKALIDSYGFELENRIFINPVCIEDRNTGFDFIKNKEKQFIVLITGSLWYGPNADGVVWFVENVWNHFKNIKSIKLIVAGSKPCEGVIKACSFANNIELVKNPLSIDKYFKTADLYVAPVFSGAGMKVKIAEAMMFGLPIAGTGHAFIGYELNDSSFICNNSEDFIQCIERIRKKDNSFIKKIRLQQRVIYKNNYSIEASVLNYKHMFERVL